MSVVVAYKWAADPGDARVGADGTVDWSRAKANLSEYDPVAMMVGREIADSLGTDLIGISVGPEAVAGSMAKKAALSRGLDSALLVADEAAANWNLTDTSRVLAALAERAGATIVLTGDSSVDESAHMVPAILAGVLGWQCYQDVTSVTADGDSWVLTQGTAGGQRTVRVTGPVVVAVTPDAAQVRIPGMKDILAAGKKPSEQIELADLGFSPVEVTPVSRSRPAARARKHVVMQGPAAAADFVAALRQEGAIA